MKNPDLDPIARLRAADPMDRRAPDDASSPTAARVLERVGAPDALPASRPARSPRIRASRALPVLAAAAAAVAVVGLSLPKDAPAPVRSVVGTEQATASPDRPKLLAAAEEQEAAAAQVSRAQRAEEQQFLDRLGPYPQGPTPSQVLAWLEDNCEAVNGPDVAALSPELDCALLAAPRVVNEAPGAVAADVLRALATLGGGLPTHAERCSGWDSVDPAWRTKVEQAEAGAIWVERNGTLLVLNDAETMVAPDPMPAEALAELSSQDRAIHDQIEQDLARTRVAASVSEASPASDVFVQCKPSSELEGHREQTVEDAMRTYASGLGGGHDGCALSLVESEGLLAVDFAQACQVGTGSTSSPNAEDGGPTSEQGIVVPGDDLPPPTIVEPVPTTAVGG
jgi:hypothetical protein